MPPLPQPNIELFAIALDVTRVTPSFHSGVVYKSNTNELIFLHLADHFDLRHEPVGTSQLYCVEPDLTQLGRQALALIAEELYETLGSDSIPYSFDWMGIGFDPNGLEVRGVSTGTGLTCATFVVCLLASHGHNLVDATTWQWVNEDSKFKTFILRTLTNKLGANHPHVIEMSKEKLLYRIRPCDVVGASSQSEASWPVGFHTARSAGNRIIEDIFAYLQT